MEWEYALFLFRKMESDIQRLIQASEELKQAKGGDRKRYRQQIEKAARQACETDLRTAPTIAFLWLRACYPGLENYIREVWSPCLLAEDLHTLISAPQAPPDIPRSWRIALDFTLPKPYLSKDDTEFYLLDNPVRKEWVFKVPSVAPSQWKGALRAAMVQELKRWWQGLSEDERKRKVEEFAERRFRMTLLFGDEKGEEPGALKGLAKYLDELGEAAAAKLYREKVKAFFGTGTEAALTHHRGWLHFYPTYFENIGLEIINPHPRDTGAGKQPIHFECVPAEASGVFTLLYVPLKELGEDETQADFQAVAQGLKAMFTRYGFGAKTSSGFGRAEVQWEEAEVQPERLQEEWEAVWQDRAGEPNG